jgi:hypothetical protein
MNEHATTDELLEMVFSTMNPAEKVGLSEACVQLWEWWDMYKAVRMYADSVKTRYQKTSSDREDFMYAIITVNLECVTQWNS